MIASEQYPKGLGPTVPEIAALLAEEERSPKMEFSCRANSGLAAAIEGRGRTQIVISGIEAHVCVLQTALDLLGMERSIYVVADAVASRNPWSRDIALRRMGDAGATIVTTEMVAFEWLRTAAAPQFKVVLSPGPIEARQASRAAASGERATLSQRHHVFLAQPGRKRGGTVGGSRLARRLRILEPRAAEARRRCRLNDAIDLD